VGGGRWRGGVGEVGGGGQWGERVGAGEIRRVVGGEEGEEGWWRDEGVGGRVGGGGGVGSGGEGV